MIKLTQDDKENLEYISQCIIRKTLNREFLIKNREEDDKIMDGLATISKIICQMEKESEMQNERAQI